MRKIFKVELGAQNGRYIELPLPATPYVMLDARDKAVAHRLSHRPAMRAGKDGGNSFSQPFPVCFRQVGVAPILNR